LTATGVETGVPAVRDGVDGVATAEGAVALAPEPAGCDATRAGAGRAATEVGLVRAAAGRVATGVVVAGAGRAATGVGLVRAGAGRVAAGVVLVGAGRAATGVLVRAGIRAVGAVVGADRTADPATGREGAGGTLARDVDPAWGVEVFPGMAAGRAAAAGVLLVAAPAGARRADTVVPGITIGGRSGR
jgi:hypothetical protein